jgi:hypothetical protein
MGADIPSDTAVIMSTKYVIVGLVNDYRCDHDPDLISFLGFSLHVFYGSVWALAFGQIPR